MLVITFRSEFALDQDGLWLTSLRSFGRYIYDQSLQARKDTEKHIPINLKSLLIGNGLTDPYYQFASVPEYACAPSATAFLDESACTTMKNKIGTCQKLDTYCYNNPSRFTCLPAALYCWGIEQVCLGVSFG